MPLFRPSSLSSLLALPLALLLACGTDSAPPGVTDDPGLDDIDADIGSVEADEDAGPRPIDPSPVAIGGNRSEDAGTSSEQPDQKPTDGGTNSDARAQEPGAFSGVERLLVADGKSARVYAFDVPSRSYLGDFSLNGPGTIYAAASGRYGYILESAQNQVQIMDLGLPDPALSSTPALVAPSLLRTSFSGLSPSAFGAFANDTAILFAGSSELSIFDLQSLATSTPVRSAKVPSGPGTPVVLLHLGDRLLVSEYDATSGVSELRLLDSRLVTQTRPALPCDAPEGAAQFDQVIAVGCADGVLWWNRSDDSTKTVRYPSSAGLNRVHKLAASPSSATFLTQLGDQLCLVRDDKLSCEDAPAGTIDYAFDATGKRALVLSGDGTLYFFDGETLDQRAKLALFSALPAGTPLAELPGLAVGRRNVYVTDPSGARIYIVDSVNARESDRLELRNGFPTQVVVFRYNF